MSGTETLRLSPAGLALIKRFEGLRLEAYRDAAGVWTIGYGHTSKALDAAAEAATGEQRPRFSIEKGRVVIDEADAEALLRADAGRFEQAVRAAVAVPLEQHEFDALVSLAFNIGAAAFAGSTVVKRLNRGDRAGAAEAILWWDKARINGKYRRVEGLARRRAAERALFLGANPVSNEPC
ncbi:lysozyme [Amphiplicatus metriothermophilus]|uniref:Lysozyme n=1 Tax=Amphiplicatus metriothermophilus TaxID=1519374 RepID=A0A239Q0C8_9PROT|nr:lysozyme [Amphiplicatus metriothermophilus]MBB5520080.1 lysozyme [Amphiplicatus metriothermophilus]SNT75880.1 Phage-related lysozyme (muramidase), GH24 family [Amphiplicatus metriothermophilus]